MIKWTKIELECLLLIFIYSNFRFVNIFENADLTYQYIKTYTKRNHQKIPTITLAILSEKNKIKKHPTQVSPGKSGEYTR